MTTPTEYEGPTEGTPQPHVRYPAVLFQRIFTPRDELRPQRWNWHVLTRRMDYSIRRSSRTPLAPNQVRGLRYFLFDGLFSSFSENLAATFIPLFALAFGATNSEIGILTAAGNLLGTISLFPGARSAELAKSRKAVVLWTGGGVSRLMFVVLTVLPLFVLPRGAAVWIIIAVTAARAFLNNFANPPWTEMVAGLVPSAMRGKYFTSRGQMMGIAALIAAPLGGWLIRALNSGTGNTHFGYQAVFLGSLVFGAASTLSFSRIPEPADTTPRRRHRRGDLRKALRGSPEFAAFIVGAFFWNLSIQVAGPFFNVYMVTDLKTGIEIVGYSTGLTSLATLVGQYLFGRFLDTKGSFWVQRLTGLIIPVLPALWMIAREPYQVYIISLLSGLFWGGYNLSNFNLLLEYSPNEQRPRAVALYQTVVFSSAVIGPLLGGYLIDTFSFRLCFGVSSVGRYIGVGLFLLLFKVLVARTKKHHRPQQE